MPRRLFLTRIDAPFDPASDLALGPWCFMGREAEFPFWTGLDFVEAFDSLEERRIACDQVRWMLAHQIERLAAGLNRRHGRNYPLIYWWILAAPWLSRLLPALWRRWWQAEKFIARHGTGELDVPVWDTASVCWDFIDAADFMNRGLRGSLLGEWMVLLVLEQLWPKAWQRLPIAPPEEVARVIPEPPYSTNRLKRWLRRHAGRLRVADIPGASPAAMLSLSALAVLLPAKKRRIAIESGFVPPPARPIDPKLAQLADLVVDRTLPAMLGGDWSRREAEALAVGYCPGKLHVSAAALQNAGSMFIHAHAAAAGERIVRYQHGTNYGTCFHAFLHEAVEYAYSTLLTWGWTGHDDARGHFMPLPAPQLLRRAASAAKRKNRFVFVGALYELTTFMICSHPLPTQWAGYRADKARFLAALPGDLRTRVVYRPNSRSASDLDDRVYLNERFPGLGMLDGPLEPQLLASRLLIIDHPGTTLLQAMAADLPTIAFWRADVWPNADSAGFAFAGLERAGILYRTPEEAAAQLTRVGDGLEDWWRSEPVQAARRLFAQTYARRSRLWWLHWARALIRLD